MADIAGGSIIADKAENNENISTIVVCTLDHALTLRVHFF